MAHGTIFGQIFVSFRDVPRDVQEVDSQLEKVRVVVLWWYFGTNKNHASENK